MKRLPRPGALIRAAGGLVAEAVAGSFRSWLAAAISSPHQEADFALQVRAVSSSCRKLAPWAGFAAHPTLALISCSFAKNHGRWLSNASLVWSSKDTDARASSRLHHSKLISKSAGSQATPGSTISTSSKLRLSPSANRNASSTEVQTIRAVDMALRPARERLIAQMR